MGHYNGAARTRLRSVVWGVWGSLRLGPSGGREKSCNEGEMIHTLELLVYHLYFIFSHQEQL